LSVERANLEQVYEIIVRGNGMTGAKPISHNEFMTDAVSRTGPRTPCYAQGSIAMDGSC